MKNQRHRKVKKLAQSHKARKQKSYQYDPKPAVCLNGLFSNPAIVHPTGTIILFFCLSFPPDSEPPWPNSYVIFITVTILSSTVPGKIGAYC